MAFTPQQARNSIITKCEQIFSDSGKTNHLYFVIEIEDENGNIYDWKDFDLQPNANTNAIRSSIYQNLISNVSKKPAIPNIETPESKSSVIGTSPDNVE